MAIPLEACRGCTDDFYNAPGNALDGKRCWSAKDGKMVTRYRIGTWTTPTTPGAFTQVTVPSCRRQKGEHFYERLPDFVRVEDVINYRRPRVRKA